MDADRIKGKVNQGLGQAQSAYGRWMDDDVEALRGDVRSEAGFVEERLGQAKDSMRDAVDRAGAVTEAAYEAARKQAERGATVLNRQIEANPAVGILVAAAVGYLLATLFRGRRR